MSRQNSFDPFKAVLIYDRYQESFAFVSGKIMECRLPIAHVLSHVASVLGRYSPRCTAKG